MPTNGDKSPDGKKVYKDGAWIYESTSSPVASIDRNVSGNLVVTKRDGSSKTLPDSLQTQNNTGDIQDLKLFDTNIASEVDDVKNSLHDPVSLDSDSDPALQLINQSLKLTLPPQIDLTKVEPVNTLPDLSAADTGVVYVVSEDGAYMLNEARDNFVGIADLSTIKTLTTAQLADSSSQVAGLVNGENLHLTLRQKEQEIFTSGTHDLDNIRTPWYHKDVYVGGTIIANIPPHGFDSASTQTHVTNHFAGSDQYGYQELTAINGDDIKTYARSRYSGDWRPWIETTNDPSLGNFPDLEVNPGVGVDLNNHLTSDGSSWIKTLSGGRETISLRVLDPALTLVVRDGDVLTAHPSGDFVDLTGTAWRAERNGNEITIFTFGSSAPTGVPYDLSNLGSSYGAGDYNDISALLDENNDGNTIFVSDYEESDGIALFQGNLRNALSNIVAVEDQTSETNIANNWNLSYAGFKIYRKDLDAYRYWNGSEFKPVSSQVLTDKSVNEGTVYNVEDHLTESGEIWFKTTSGEKESIQFQNTSPAITFRARFEGKQVAFAPNAPVTLEGSAWRAKRDGNLITLFSIGSEVNILTTTDEVTLIDADASNGTLYPFSTGETWGEIKAKYSRLIFTGNSSRSGSPQIRSWSKIVDLGDQAGAFSQSGYRLDMINAEGVHIYVDTPNDSSTGLRYRQSGGDAPTSGRMQFKVVAVLKKGTDEFVAKDDLLPADRGWVKLANTPTIASGTGYHDAGDIQTTITGADGDQIAVTYGSGSREIMTFLDGIASTQRGGDIQRAKVLPSGQVQLSNTNGGTGYGDIWVKPAALTAHLDAIEVDRTGLADGDILIYDQAGDRLVRGDKAITEERVLELIEQFKGGYKDYASPADIPDNHIGRSGGKLYSKDQDSDQPDLLRIQQ